MQNEIKAVVFDMDGVLLDTESMSDKTWQKAAKEFNINVTDEILNKCRGSNRSDIVAKLKNIYGKDFDAEHFLKRTGDFFQEMEFSSGIPLMPYAKEILEYLKDRYALALASSTTGSAVERQLTNANLISYFSKRVTGEMVEHSKPAPQIYLKACKELGISPADCIAVEDSPNGIRSAYAASMKVIMVPDRISPDEEIKKLCFKILPSLKDLKGIL